jgi:hypothetical protein
MTCSAVRCPHCDSAPIVTRGQTHRGTPRDLGQHTACARGSVLRDDRNRGCVPEVRPPLIAMRRKARGVRDSRAGAAHPYRHRTAGTSQERSRAGVGSSDTPAPHHPRGHCRASGARWRRRDGRHAACGGPDTGTAVGVACHGSPHGSRRGVCCGPPPRRSLWAVASAARAGEDHARPDRAWGRVRASLRC